MSDVDQARAEMLAYGRRLGNVLKRSRRYGGDGGDSSSFYDENRARIALDDACVAYAKALEEQSCPSR